MRKLNRYFLIALSIISISFCSSFQIVADYEQEILFTDKSIEILDYETGENSPYSGQMLTYTTDEDNNIIRVEDDSVATQASVKQIIVYIGTTIVGYLSSTVVDGIVVSVTCQSGAWWVSQAIQNVLKRKYTGRTYVNCNVYPMHSYEGAMCRVYA